jgi:hypothetical protein
MSDIGQADSAAPEVQRAQTRLALGALLVPIFFVSMFALCIIGTYHKPHPNDIKVGVVGPAAQTAPLRAGLQKAGGSAFDFRQVATVAEATKDVRERHLSAALVPAVDPSRPATVIVASGGGRLVAKASEDFLRAATAAQGTRLAVRDVRPLADGDALGLGVFLFMIVCTIGGYLGVTVLAAAAPDLAPTRRYPMIVAVAVLVPTIVYLIGGLGFGTYVGSTGTILAFIGVGALYTLAIGLVTRLLQVLLGPPALFVSLAIFVFLNIPSLGATYTPEMLSPFWRFFNEFWIGAETVDAERSLLYFGGPGVGTDLLRLLAWTGVIVALLLPPVARRVGRQRSVLMKGESSWRASTMTS